MKSTTRRVIKIADPTTVQAVESFRHRVGIRTSAKAVSRLIHERLAQLELAQASSGVQCDTEAGSGNPKN